MKHGTLPYPRLVEMSGCTKFIPVFQLRKPSPGEVLLRLQSNHMGGIESEPVLELFRTDVRRKQKCPYQALLIGREALRESLPCLFQQVLTVGLRAGPWEHPGKETGEVPLPAAHMLRRCLW